MESVYDELMTKIRNEGGTGTRGGARQDLGLVLFSQREGLGELWKAAARALEAGCPDEGLRSAVERLKPFFGER